MEDAGIIELFFERSEQGIRELDIKYGKACRKLSYNIVNDRQDAEECVNDAYLGAWNAIPPVKPDPLLTYICKIVRNISLNLYHRKEAAKRSSHYTIAMEEIEACIAATNAVEAEIEAVELAHIIERFLDTLTVENRVLFMRRYWFSDSCRAFGEKCLRPADPYPRKAETISDRTRGVYMNARQFAEAMSELDDRYVAEALFYKRPYTSRASPKKLVLLIAAIVAVLALCGFTAHELGLFDRWFQKPSADPTQTVQSAIEGQADKVYTICVRIEAINVDESETERVVRMYAGSELAGSRGWTDEYLSEHFVVVSAKYYVEYDHTKTFLDDGYTEQYFYLVQDPKTEKWEIIDNTSPSTSNEP